MEDIKKQTILFFDVSRFHIQFTDKKTDLVIEDKSRGSFSTLRIPLDVLEDIINKIKKYEV